MVPARLTFFIDRCLGKGVFERLKAEGADVEFLDERFSQEEADPDWIPEVSARDRVILTKDGRMRRKHAELEAIRKAGARIVTLRSGNLRGAEMAELFATRLPEIEGFVAAHAAPFVAVLYRDGTIEKTLATSRGRPARGGRRGPTHALQLTRPGGRVARPFRCIGSRE